MILFFFSDLERVYHNKSSSIKMPWTMDNILLHFLFGDTITQNCASKISQEAQLKQLSSDKPNLSLGTETSGQRISKRPQQLSTFTKYFWDHENRSHLITNTTYQSWDERERDKKYLNPQWHICTQNFSRDCLITFSLSAKTGKKRMQRGVPLETIASRD